MAKPKPGLEDEWEVVQDRADTPTRERPPVAPNSAVPSSIVSNELSSMVDSCQISDVNGDDNDSENLEEAVAPQTVEAPKNAPSASVLPEGRRASHHRQDPSNSVVKVREAYRTMARVGRHSGQRRIRRYENAFFDEGLDEDELQEHLHVKTEWRSSFQALLRPENKGLRDAFVKVEFPFDEEIRKQGKKSSSRKKGVPKREYQEQDPKQLFLGVDKRLRQIVIKCFERCEWYICWLQKVLQWYIQTTSHVLAKHATAPIIAKNGRFPAAPKLPDSLKLKDGEEVMLEAPQCFFLEGKNDSKRMKEKKGDELMDNPCPSIFLLLRLKDDSYMRLLTHATAQFYKLRTKTMACEGCEKAIVVRITKNSLLSAEIDFSTVVKAHI